MEEAADMSRNTRRQAARRRRQRERTRSYLIWGGIILGALAIPAFLIWNVVKPAAGDAVPIMGAQHIAEGTVPEGGYNSEPPTSGPHYASPMQAGFYDERDPEAQVENPEGYLVHNLEHGYVVFWYNCEALSNGAECSDLKSEIQGVLDRFNGVKLIAFPHRVLDVPVVATSWGRIQRFDPFDPRAAVTFVRRNRNRAPEAGAE
jgi:hypothetical protein